MLLFGCSFRSYWRQHTFLWTTVDGRNPANQLIPVSSLSHYLRGVYIPGGCLGFLNHQQYDHFIKAEWPHCHLVFQIAFFPFRVVVIWPGLMCCERKNDIPPKKTTACYTIWYIWMLWDIIPSFKLGSFSWNINYHKHGQLATAHSTWVVMNYQPKLHALFSREIPEICPRNICGCQVIQAVTFKRDGEWKRDPNSEVDKLTSNDRGSSWVTATAAESPGEDWFPQIGNSMIPGTKKTT